MIVKFCLPDMASSSAHKLLFCAFSTPVRMIIYFCLLTGALSCLDEHRTQPTPASIVFQKSDMFMEQHPEIISI